MSKKVIAGYLLFVGLIAFGIMQASQGFMDTLMKPLTTPPNIASIESQSGKTYNIYLDEPIQSPSQMRETIKVLQAAQEKDIVRFHIANFGGDGEALHYLVSNIKSTKATTVSLVQAPAYSAHAMIAVSTNKLEMSPGTFLMFHTISSHGFDCSKLDPKDTDRGRNPIPKCRQLIGAVDKESDFLIRQSKILTPEEKDYILEGYDVYLFADEIQRRQATPAVVQQSPMLRDPITLPPNVLPNKITIITAEKQITFADLKKRAKRWD